MKHATIALAATFVVFGFLNGTAVAQEGAPAARRIAPELFHPYSPSGIAVVTPQAPIALPSKEHPFGSCSRETREWLSCLRATAMLSDGMVAEAEIRVLSQLDQRPEFGLAMRQIFVKELSLANSQWRSLREQECAQLAMLEVRRRVQLYEAKLTCEIAHNIERADQLAARYGAPPAGNVP